MKNLSKKETAVTLAIACFCLLLTLFISSIDAYDTYKKYRNYENRNKPVVDWSKSTLEYAEKVGSIRSALKNIQLSDNDYIHLSKLDPENGIVDFLKLRSLGYIAHTDKDIKVEADTDSLSIKVFNKKRIKEIVKIFDTLGTKSEFSIYSDEYLFEAGKELGFNYFEQCEKIELALNWFPNLQDLVYQLYLLYPADLDIEIVRERLQKLKKIVELLLDKGQYHHEIHEAWYISEKIIITVNKLSTEKRALLSEELQYFERIKKAFMDFSNNNMNIRKENWYKITDDSLDAFTVAPLYLSENLDELVKPNRLLQYSKYDRIANFIPIIFLFVIIILLLPYLFRKTESFSFKLPSVKFMLKVYLIPALLLTAFSFIQPHLPYRSVVLHWTEHTFIMEKVVVYTLLIFVPVYLLASKFRDSSRPILKTHILIILILLFLTPVCLSLIKGDFGERDFHFVLMGSYVVMGIIITLYLLYKYLRSLIKQNEALKVKQALPAVVLYLSFMSLILALNGFYIQGSIEVKFAKAAPLSEIVIKDKKARLKITDEYKKLFLKVYDRTEPDVRPSVRANKKVQKFSIEYISPEELKDVQQDSLKEEGLDRSRRRRMLSP